MGPLWKFHWHMLLDGTGGAEAAVLFALGAKVKLDSLGVLRRVAGVIIMPSVEFSLAGAEVSLDGTGAGGGAAV